MTTYAIGDLQGCCEPLERLLDLIDFDPVVDRLWFAGDLVNRGPASLRSLRTVMALGDSAITVLGNHEMHLLGVMCGFRKPSPKDTLDDILVAADREELFDWLRTRPLLHHDATLGFTLVHAGLHPHWNLDTARTLATEVESALRGEHHREFLHSVFSNKPANWDAALAGIERLRFAINCFTRMRYCTKSGKLNFDYKGPREKAPADLLPWYQVPGRLNSDENILFGHWASHGESDQPGIHALDFGCVWGGKLVAMALETEQYLQVDCSGASDTESINS